MKTIALFQTILFSVIVFIITASSTSKKIGEFSDAVEIQHIRNATAVIAYKNVKILVDPILADEGTQPPISFSNQIKNPTIQLPVDKFELIKSINAVLLTHYHEDHFDREAERILPKNTLIFCQPGDDTKLQEKGFTNTQVIDSTFAWKGITISRFRASHHIGANGAPPFGESSSFFLQTENESIFFTGDAIFDDRLKTGFSIAKPELIIANTGECQFTKENPVLAPGTPMTLTAAELKEISQYVPESKIMTVHMDAINHCSLTKDELREYLEKEELEKKVIVPNEGELLLYDELIGK